MIIVKELLFWSYANFAMAHTAVDSKQEKYATFNYMIRARLRAKARNYKQLI